MPDPGLEQLGQRLGVPLYKVLSAKYKQYAGKEPTSTSTLTEEQFADILKATWVETYSQRANKEAKNEWSRLEKRTIPDLWNASFRGGPPQETLGFNDLMGLFIQGNGVPPTPEESYLATQRNPNDSFSSLERLIDLDFDATVLTATANRRVMLLNDRCKALMKLLHQSDDQNRKLSKQLADWAADRKAAQRLFRCEQNQRLVELEEEAKAFSSEKKDWVDLERRNGQLVKALADAKAKARKFAKLAKSKGRGCKAVEKFEREEMEAARPPPPVLRVVRGPILNIAPAPIAQTAPTPVVDRQPQPTGVPEQQEETIPELAVAPKPNEPIDRAIPILVTPHKAPEPVSVASAQPVEDAVISKPNRLAEPEVERNAVEEEPAQPEVVDSPFPEVEPFSTAPPGLTDAIGWGSPAKPAQAPPALTNAIGWGSTARPKPIIAREYEYASVAQCKDSKATSPSYEPPQSSPTDQNGAFPDAQAMTGVPLRLRDARHTLMPSPLEAGEKRTQMHGGDANLSKRVRKAPKRQVIQSTNTIQQVQVQTTYPPTVSAPPGFNSFPSFAGPVSSFQSTFFNPTQSFNNTKPFPSMMPIGATRPYQILQPNVGNGTHNTNQTVPGPQPIFVNPTPMLSWNGTMMPPVIGHPVHVHSMPPVQMAVQPPRQQSWSQQTADLSTSDDPKQEQTQASQFDEGTFAKADSKPQTSPSVPDQPKKEAEVKPQAVVEKNYPSPVASAEDPVKENSSARPTRAPVAISKQPKNEPATRSPIQAARKATPGSSWASLAAKPANQPAFKSSSTRKISKPINEPSNDGAYKTLNTTTNSWADFNEKEDHMSNSWGRPPTTRAADRTYQKPSQGSSSYENHQRVTQNGVNRGNNSSRRRRAPQRRGAT